MPGLVYAGLIAEFFRRNVTHRHYDSLQGIEAAGSEEVVRHQANLPTCHDGDLCPIMDIAPERRRTLLSTKTTERSREMSDKSELNRLLKIAKSYKMTSAERETQRQSFAYGNANIENRRVTKELVAEAAQKLARDGQS